MNVRCKLRGWGLCVLLATGACIGGRDHAVDEPAEVEGALAALLDDGPLPDAMKAPPGMPEPPPRFCGGSPDDSDAGVAVPGLPVGGKGLPGTAGAGSRAGSGGAAAPSGIDPACAKQPIGFWKFDDCNAFRSDLQDSSQQGHTAFRSVQTSCTGGRQGQGIAFMAKDDLVYAPDQPDYGLQHGVTLAAWVKPERVDRTQTLLRKRDDGSSAVALLINGGRFQFVVRLSSGRMASVSAPARANQWTHVAATYDGTDLRLYLDGVQRGRTRAHGDIARSVGPLLIGDDASGRRLYGAIDNVWFNTLAAPADTILTLTCIEQDPVLSVEPLTSGPLPAGATQTYTLAIASQNRPECAPQTLFSFVNTPPELSAEPNFQFLSLRSGETLSVPIAVRSGDDAEAGSYPIDFLVSVQSGSMGPIALPPITVSAAAPSAADGGMTSDNDPFTGFVRTQAQYVVAEPEGCHVSTRRELFIRDVSVVDDAARTQFVPGDARGGAWSFGRLLERLSPTAADAPDVIEQMFRGFLSEQTVNGFSVEARPPMDPLVLQSWPRTPNGKLDLSRAPVRLLAIVHRLDLKDAAQHKAGEGRFVYGVLDPSGNPLEFTVIFEYALRSDAGDWEADVHALQALPFPSEAYNAALQALTDRFTGKDPAWGLPNDSALIDIRTNEIALSPIGVWQLREFHIGDAGFMQPAPLFQTPDGSFNGSDRLGRFVNANEAAILAETHEVPALFEGETFQAGAVFNNIDFWSAPGITNPQARHKLSLNTCNGCHGAETQTFFLHVQPRVAGQASSLSSFLTGETVFDPVSGVQRRLSELKRRRELLERAVCPTP